MAKFKSLSFWYGLLLMVLTVSFTACVDDNDDTEAPYLEVDPTTLTFENGGTQSFNISTNRPWNAAVEDNTNWVTLSKTSGEGSTTVQVSVPEGTNGEAKINITIGNQSGPLKTATVTVKSGVVVESKVLYSETVGNKSVSSPWPLAGEYDGWNKTGDAAANVTYAGNNASVRSSGLANTDAYEGASGPNVVFFGSAPANFDIQKIALAEGQTNLKLTFGGSRSSKGDDGQYDNTFDTSKFKVELSADGTAWTEIAYEKNNGDAETPYWIFATANFTLKKATSELYIRFTANESSVYRLDDITLATGNGGQEVDLEGGSVVEPGEATAITIPELIALMPEPMSTGEVIDANADRFFEAVVQADVENGNFTTNNLQVATEGATGEKNGVTLYGSQVDPKTLGLKMGDKVKVTLVKGAAKVQNYQGLYEVTGAKDETWCKVEKVGTANVTPIEITADKLAAYQAMTVTIKNASSNGAGTWCTADKYDTHTFTAGETDDDYIVLTDIQGLEDFFGDMDFKVTGTTEGITAIQMDIKIHGLTRPIVEEAIRRTREARLFIMDTCMKPAIAEPRKTVGEYAPKIIQTSIDPAKIGEVVGQRGKTINAIIDECGVKIDITDDGFVSVCGVEQAGMDKAMKYIKTIVEDFEEGKIYEGKVVSIKEFGAFVEFAPGKEGMVHISKISNERINHVEDVLTLGDHVKCKCMGKDKMGRISFSIKDAM